MRVVSIITLANASLCQRGYNFIAEISVLTGSLTQAQNSILLVLIFKNFIELGVCTRICNFKPILVYFNT